MTMLRPVVNHFCGLVLTTRHMADITYAVEEELTQSRKGKRRGLAAPNSGKCPKTTPAVVSRGAANMAERLAQYQDFSEMELRMHLLKLEDDLDVEKENKRSLQVKVWKVARDKERLPDKFEELQEEHSSLISLTKMRKSEGSHVHVLAGYCMPLKKSKCNAALETTVSMLGSDKHQGIVKDLHTVAKYEHRSSLAKAVRSMQFHEDAVDISNLDFFESAFDGTQQGAIRREKVHMSIFTSSVVKVPDSSDEGGPGSTRRVEIAQVEKETRSLTTIGDLQIQYTGDGLETYNLVKAEMSSVGVPHMEDRKTRSLNPPGGSTPIISVYFFWNRRWARQRRHVHPGASTFATLSVDHVLLVILPLPPNPAHL